MKCGEQELRSRGLVEASDAASRSTNHAPSPLVPEATSPCCGTSRHQDKGYLCPEKLDWAGYAKRWQGGGGRGLDEGSGWGSNKEDVELQEGGGWGSELQAEGGWGSELQAEGGWGSDKPLQCDILTSVGDMQNVLAPPLRATSLMPTTEV